MSKASDIIKEMLPEDAHLERVFRFYAEHLAMAANSMSEDEGLDAAEAFALDMASSGPALKPPGIENGVPANKIAEFRAFNDVFATYLEFRSIQGLMDRLMVVVGVYEKSQAFRLSIHLFVSQAYILKERIKVFSEQIKAGKSENSIEAISRVCGSTIRRIEKDFADVLKIRNQHTHLGEYDDPDLRRLSTLELFLRLGDEPPKMAPLYEKKIEDVRHHWRSKFAEADSRSVAIMNGFARDIFPLISKSTEI